MPLPLDTSKKVGITGRAKALGVLALPFLAFAVVVFLASSLQTRLGTPRASQVAQPSDDNGMSLDVKEDSGVQVAGTTSVTTTVTTYTMLGTF
jgi:hypothetical protein